MKRQLNSAGRDGGTDRGRDDDRWGTDEPV